MSLACKLKVSMKNRPAGFIQALTKMVKVEIKEETPVDTGRLRGGWRAKGNNSGTIELWNGVDYAEHVNARGTHRNFASCAHLQRLVNGFAKDVQKDLE